MKLSEIFVGFIKSDPFNLSGDPFGFSGRSNLEKLRKESKAEALKNRQAILVRARKKKV